MTHPPNNYTRLDFRHSPFIAFYEVTRACDLVCKHCRACAQPRPDPNELDHEMSKQLLEQLATFPKRPLLVFTGGDPLKRGDIIELIAYAKQLGLNVALTPSATPLVTAQAIREMKHAGLRRLAVSLDGADAATHDAFRRVKGSFERTLQIMAHARDAELPQQVNTTIHGHNFAQVDAMAELLATQGIVLWSVFFLVPVGRGSSQERIAPQQYEQVFEQLWDHAQHQPYGIKTTEAHHYRRHVLQRAGDPQASANDTQNDRVQRAPLGVNDGKGVMFISHIGQVFPSGFLPIQCGRFPHDSIVDVYQRHPLFQALRDPDRFHRKCGACEFRHVCGGSRARAHAVMGHPLAAEPDCVYVPKAWKERLECSV